jgi:hypothetical protein
MFWVSLMQSKPSHLCPNSVWCSPHAHTFVLLQSYAVHTLTRMSYFSLMQSTRMSYFSLMQSTRSHFCPTSVLCSPRPYTYVLLQSDAVYTLILILFVVHLHVFPLLEGFELIILGLFHLPMRVTCSVHTSLNIPISYINTAVYMKQQN